MKLQFVLKSFTVTQLNNYNGAYGEEKYFDTE